MDHPDKAAGSLVRRYKMILAMMVWSVAILLGGCIQYPYTGKHVQIDGEGTPEEKEALAKSVLAALPPQEIRKQIQQRFPKFSAKDLKRIEFDYAVMNFQDKDGPPRREVHLTVTIYHNAKLHPIADQIEEFVTSLVQAELKHQRSAAPKRPQALRSTRKESLVIAFAHHARARATTELWASFGMR